MDNKCVESAESCAQLAEDANSANSSNCHTSGVVVSVVCCLGKGVLHNDDTIKDDNDHIIDSIRPSLISVVRPVNKTLPGRDPRLGHYPHLGQEHPSDPGPPPPPIK